MSCISAKNLRRVVKELDLKIDENEIQEMIDRADINNDGVITEDEFYLILTKVSSKTWLKFSLIISEPSSTLDF